jgi:catechol 2,3-dioxygenase-like lactoylglutathione lyase family enzyme
MHRVTRRRALLTLAAGIAAAARSTAQASSLDVDGIDHVEFYASDVDRTRNFLAAVFGNTLLKNPQFGRSYIKVGSSYLALLRPRAPGDPLVTDHVSLAIRGMEMPKLHAFLDARGIAYRDYPSGRDTAVVDDDGIRVQLSPVDGWSLLKPPGFEPDAVILRDEPVFRPVAIEHVLFNVADPEASARFYEKMLGPVSRRANGRIWFQIGRSRLGLLETPAGQKAGVNHFCVSAAPFDYDAAVARLTAIGAKVETPELAGSPSCRDPDGTLVQVSPAA